MKNEPALNVSGSAGSRTMPLRAAQREDGVADVGQRRARALVDAELARELGVADRLGLVARLEGEAHAQDEPAVGVALEDARAVVEQALLDVERRGSRRSSGRARARRR